jgi:hypothetical protein
MGDRINLSSAQALAPPSATWVELIRWTTDLSRKVIDVVYVWHSDTGVVPVNGKVEQTAIFTNIADDPATPGVETDAQYNRIHRVQVVAGDVDKRIGKMYKNAIITELQSRILSGGITMTDTEV